MKNAIIGLSIGILLVVGGYLGYQYMYPEEEIHNHSAYHVHADFVVILNGEKFNFAQEKYMVSTDVCKLEYQTKHTHLHDMNGDTVHVHQEKQSWGDFFKNIGFTLTQDLSKKENVLETDEGKVFGAGRLFINGKEIPKEEFFNGYEIKDLDKVAFFFGATTEKNIVDGLAKITNKACIYSGACPVPEGVKLPQEYCGSE